VGGTILLMSILWLGYQYVVPYANRIWGEFEKNILTAPIPILIITNHRSSRNYISELIPTPMLPFVIMIRSPKNRSGFVVQKIVNNQLQYNLRPRILVGILASNNGNWNMYQKGK
jgi:hypothetical protein